MSAMNRHTVLARLREHQTELHAAGVAHLQIFGSAARDQMQPGSDVDVLLEFQPGTRVTLLVLGGLQQRLSAMVGADVDLPSSTWLREPIRERALAEAVLAF